MKRTPTLKTIRPNILVLEGLWDDTSKALRAAGAHAYEETPWTFADSVADMKAGQYHGLVLTGGSDINPALYGADKDKSVYGVDPHRDYEEYQALTLALELGIPVLGICRGSQIMTAFRGGELCQDIAGHRSTEHPVYAATGARTFKRAINSRMMNTISLHHQCVLDPGPGMRFAAFAADGTPEAVESTDGLWLGVQFHPELAAFDNGNAFAIFQWMVSEAAKYAGGVAPITRFRDIRDERLIARAALAEEQRQRALMAPPSASSQALSVGTTVLTAHKPRKAGDPSVPSMRDMVSIVEGSATRHWLDHRKDSELQVCAGCGLLFDEEDDRLDHEFYVCGVGALEPPDGHPAWDPHR